jgi:WD40 repeat protein
VADLRDVAVTGEYGRGNAFLAFSPDGRLLACGGRDGVARVYDVSSRREKMRLSEPGSLLRSVAFSPDGKTLATGTERGEVPQVGDVCLWDLATGRELRRFPKAGPLAVFSPDGKALAIYAADNFHRSIALCETDTGAELRRLAHPAAVNRVAFSMDGKMLAAITDQYTRQGPALRGKA